jgi:hypothetical protein
MLLLGSFRLKPTRLLLLLGVLATITLVLVLPQIDLLDTAFQRNSSPLALRAHFHSAPLIGALVSVSGISPSTNFPSESRLHASHYTAGISLSPITLPLRC